MRLRTVSVVSVVVLFLALFMTIKPVAYFAVKGIPRDVASGESTEADWWSMFQHDVAHTGYSTSSAPDTSETRFIVNYTTGHDGGFIVVDGRLIISGGAMARSYNHSLYCINATSGRFLWASAERFTTDAIPAASGNNVVVQAVGILYCFCVDDGSIKWKFQYSQSGYGNLPSPIIHDGVVFFSSGTTGTIDPTGSMFALSLLEMENATCPKLIWKKPLGSVRASTPAYSNGRIFLSYFPSSAEYMICLNATNGAEIWQRSDLTPSYESAPTVVYDKVYFGTPVGKLCCIDELTGELLWSAQLPTEGSHVNIDASPAVANGRVFVGTLTENVYHAKFFSLNATNGQMLWEYQTDRTGEPFSSSPAIADGKVFVSAANLTYAFNETNGNLVWSYQTNGPWLGSCVGGPAIALGSVYVLDGKGYVYCFNTKFHFNIIIDPEFFDNRGEPLVPPPSSWNILFPNETKKTVSGVETYYGPMGTWTINSVTWNGFEVLRLGPVSFLLDTDSTWSPHVDCILPTSLSLSLSSSTSFTGFKVGIGGNLTCNNVGVAGSAIFLAYSATAGKIWSEITLANTVSDGGYSALWMPQATGSYIVRVVWAGNSTFPTSTKTVNLAVIPFEETNVFSVVSNSTVYELSFESVQKELTFKVEGPSGTMGYADVYVAKTLIGNIEEVEVKLNGTEINYTATSLDDSWLIHITYQHSAHSVAVNLGASVPPPGETTGIDALTAALLIGILVTILLASIFLLIRRKSSTLSKANALT